MQKDHARTLAGVGSEVVALTWSDIDLYLMRVRVQRSCVRNDLGDTEASRKPIPLHPSGVKCLETWRKKSSGRDEHFIIPSVRCNGNQPLSPDTLLKKVISRAVKRAGIKGKTIGWHSFRHLLGDEPSRGSC
jgi:integrase